MIRIREIEAADATDFLALCKRLDNETTSLLNGRRASWRSRYGRAGWDDERIGIERIFADEIADLLVVDLPTKPRTTK